MTVLDAPMLAPGAVIQSVSRDELWVRITTDRGTIYFAGAREAMELECPRCREFRLVEIIETAKARVGFCRVCAHTFPIETEK